MYLLLYRNFPLYTLWANLLNVASHMIIPVLLGYFFSPAIVGFYALGYRVLTVPMNVAGGAIAQVFFPRANEAKINGNLEQITFDVFKKLVAIGLVPLALIAISAPDLFSLVFGKQWETAGEYVKYLSIWIFFNLFLPQYRQFIL